MRYSVGRNSYSARTFGIPFHEYDGYTVRTETYRRAAGCIGFYDENGDPQQACWAESDVTRNNEPCQSGVADGFFQTVAGGRNDFPVLQITDPDATETAEPLKSWGTSRNSGCDEFTAAQDRLVSTAAANGGYYLDSHGNLATGSLPVHVLSSRSLAPSRVGWDSRGGFWIHRGTVGATAGSGYVSRVDAGSTLAVSPSGTSLSVPTPNWPATKHQNGNVSWSSLTSFNSAGHLALPMAIGGTSSGVWCPTGFHPRGEDGLQRVGRGSGRTLTSLASDTKIAQADKFWCRSDVRYRIRYKKQTHSQTCGASPRPTCPSGVTLPNDRFSAYGRVNCYYTVISLDTVNSNTCRYYHPIPQCTDPDSNAKREYTSAELATYTAGEKFPAKTDGTTSCGEAGPADPPQQAGFTADPCVTADMEIYENRIVGSDAEPGVPASDRTLVVAAGRTAWDLDVTSPHPLTASPPRDAAAGSGDPDGCADGSESRADHASAPGDAARSQSPAPSYAASIRTDTAVPPNDADGDINYRGATRGMAHRYASLVAENTCAVKLAEAEAELSLLELREDGFAQWLADYKTAADTNASRYSSYTRTPQQSGAGLAILRFNDMEANKETYAGLLATRYTSLSSALSAAKTEYDLRTDRASGSNRASVIQATTASGCVAHYDAEITRLKTLFAAAETTALGNGSKGIKEERNAVAGTNLVVPPGIAVADTSAAYKVPSISANLARTVTTSKCPAGSAPYSLGGCIRNPDEGEECNLFGGGCPATPTVTTTYYYTCPDGNYSVAGTVSRSYKGTPRSARYSTTYTAAGRSSESTSSICPGWTSALTDGYSYATYSAAVSYVMGTPGAASSLPSTPRVSAAASLAKLDRLSLLGSYHPTHGDRAGLKSNSDSDRRTAGKNFTAAAGSVPSGSPDEIDDYRDDYTQAYDTAFTRASGHMSGTAWENFDWRYHSPSLAWSIYQEDPATTYSASTATPRDGTGCDLISIASDGMVSVEATRLDYETSSYGKGSVYSTRTDAQRTCKIRRTRTPELLLEYQPSRPSGTDTSKTVSSFYVNYQPTPAAERFKLYDEAEVFAVRASLSDSPPVFCAANIPSTIYVSHAAGAMSDISAAISAGRLYRTSTTVLRPTAYSATPQTGHCFRSSFASTSPVKIAVFDDTAHTAMNLVYLEKDPADTSQITLLATGGALTADPAVAYPGDSAQSSRFYGATYSVPGSLGSSAGWDVLGDNNPATDLNTKIKNRIVARDKTVSPNLPAVPADTTFKHVSAMGFNIGFLDCRPDIENVVFIGNIVSATAASNQANDYAGITVPNNYQTETAKALEAPVWYYPPWRLIKGQTRTATAEEPGTTIREGSNSGIFTHPQSARYGWVIETYNNIATDKQPVSGFWNRPDVKHGDPNRPESVSLEEHRRVCLGDRDAMPHYRTANAALPASDPTRDTLGYPTDRDPQQALVVWSEHNPLCKPENGCREWTTRCYLNADNSAAAEQTDCPAAGQQLPAGVTRYPDKALIDANIKRILADSDLADTEQAAKEAAELISDKAMISDGITPQPRWPWLTAGQKIFDCDSRWWYCLRTAVTLHGIDQYEWLRTRQLRIAFQYTLPKWGNALVSTLDRDTPDEQAAKVAVNILIQTVRIVSR